MVSLAGCAGTGETPATTAAPKSGGAEKFVGDARLGEELQQLCPVLAITDFSDNSRDTVVISLNKESFLIETRRTCYPLRDAMGIGVPPGATCLRPGDQLLVTDAGPGGQSTPLGTDRCTINRIFRWTPAQRVETPKAKAS
jgi:hypothetical protein